MHDPASRWQLDSIAWPAGLIPVLPTQVDPAFIEAETQIEMGKEDIQSRPEKFRCSTPGLWLQPCCTELPICISELCPVLFNPVG